MPDLCLAIHKGLVFIFELFLKIILSLIAWCVFYWVHWQLYIGDHAGETGAWWAAILINAYCYMVLAYLIVDYGFLIRFLRPQPPKAYWTVTVLTLFLITFGIGFSIRWIPALPNILLWQDYYIHHCLFGQAAGDKCAHFPSALKSLFHSFFE